VKRTVCILAGVVALMVAAYVGSHLQAQSPQSPGGAPAATAPLRTRIALVNLNYVIKNYDKYVTFQGEMKADITNYDKEYEKMQDGLKQWQTRLQQLAPTEAPKRDEAEHAIREYQRRLQDMNEEAKKRLGSKADTQAVILYKEVETAVQRYARGNEIELVLHFNDATGETEVNHPANIQRKIQTGACMPMYAAPGMDITKPIIDLLNQSYRAAMGAPAARAPGQ
jgi:Skp family chaperone for outer membrane proteins